MAISGITSATAVSPVSFPSFDGTEATSGASGENFGNKLGDALQTLQDQQKPVSYTHLTLPTIYSV